MLYAVLRAITGISLRWFYRDIRIRHADRIPRSPTPLLLAVNHPNALVDALVVGWALRRRLTITAKATLFESPVLGWFLQLAGVVPLRRASDERKRRTAGTGPDTVRSGTGEQIDQARNEEAFRAIIDRLDNGGAILIFPEGKSHDEPALAPLRTGPARIALRAQREACAKTLAILPVGLVFEQKETPRSRVLVDIGEPLYVHDWIAEAGDAAGVDALTREIGQRLHEVTLNYATADEAALTRGLAQVFASLLDHPLSIGTDRPLEDEIELERRLGQAQRVLDSEAIDPTIHARGEELLNRLAAFERIVCAERIAVGDVAIPLGSRHGVWFAIREGLLLTLLGPVALWGRANHWLPFRIARNLGERDITSRDQPAMRTILAGLVLVLLFYVLATTIVTRVAGGIVAALYVASLPIAADVDLRFTERMGQARQRMRAYLRFRRNPKLRDQLAAEHAWLTREISELAEILEPQMTSRGSNPKVLPRDDTTDL
jgi:glycerol-3-phosphate O-acyltransferase / dihydroxyacetone phosphate acyltransferase